MGNCRAQIALVGVVVVSAVGPAAADPKAEAEQLFRDGKALVKAGQFAEGCTAFEGSQRLDPSLATQMNLADCRERNGQLATAWSLFLAVASQARADAQFSAMSPVAQGRADQLEPRLSHLTVNVPDGDQRVGLTLTRNGELVDPATWNRAIPIDGGHYQLTAQAPARVTWSTTIDIANEGAQRTVDVPVLERAAAPAAGGARPRRGGLTGRRKLAIGLGAGGAVALASAVGLELAGRSVYDDYKATAEGPAREALFEKANRRHQLAQVAAVAGIAGGGVAVWLWLTGGRPSRGAETAVTPLVGGDIAGVAFTGGF